MLATYLADVPLSSSRLGLTPDVMRSLCFPPHHLPGSIAVMRGSLVGQLYLLSTVHRNSFPKTSPPALPPHAKFADVKVPCSATSCNTLPPCKSTDIMRAPPLWEFTWYAVIALLRACIPHYRALSHAWPSRITYCYQFFHRRRIDYHVRA